VAQVERNVPLNRAYEKQPSKRARHHPQACEFTGVVGDSRPLFKDVRARLRSFLRALRASRPTQTVYPVFLLVGLRRGRSATKDSHLLYELIGYLASILVSLSLTMRSILRLRFMNRYQIAATVMERTSAKNPYVIGAAGSKRSR
jgi:hypothetical protein